MDASMSKAERLQSAYCVEKLGSCVGWKRKIGNSTFQNGRYDANVSQLDFGRHRKLAKKVAGRLFQHNRPQSAAC
jgi:hypothetical protein